MPFKIISRRVQSKKSKMRHNSITLYDFKLLNMAYNIIQSFNQSKCSDYMAPWFCNHHGKDKYIDIVQISTERKMLRLSSKEECDSMWISNLDNVPHLVYVMIQTEFRIFSHEHLISEWKCTFNTYFLWESRLLFWGRSFLLL